MRSIRERLTGASIHRELELLVAAGLTPREALAAATSVPAAIFGLTDRGRVSPGLRADLLLVDGDPTSQITATRAIVGVWKQGDPVDRDAYRQSVRKQVEDAARAGASPGPRGSENGLVSDFEGDQIKTAFGSGWMVSTDALVGGKSKATLTIVPDGAGGSKGSLRIAGTIDDRPQPRWAGAMFSPGTVPMAPANLTAKRSITFHARGDGIACTIMVFSQSKGFVPAFQSFDTGATWKEYRFAFKDFDGFDGKGLTGLFIGGGTEPGRFEFQIDDVRFE